jgi:hypothetical protein
MRHCVMRIFEAPMSRTRYQFVELDGRSLRPDMFPSEPFRSMIVISCPRLGLEMEQPLSKALVEARCGWVSIVGPRCKEWEETIDWENVRAVTGPPEAEDFLVVTSAHENETIEEVSGLVASILVPESRCVLVIGVGPSEDAFAKIESALQLRHSGNAA